MPPTTVGTTTVYVIGKCPIKGCRNRRRVVIHDAPIKRSGPYTYTDWQIPAPAPYDTVRAACLGPKSNNPRPSQYLKSHRNEYEKAWFTAIEAAGWICQQHDRFMVVQPVHGVVNHSKPCTGACRSAVGPSCDCACGGEFHGSNWG